MRSARGSSSCAAATAIDVTGLASRDVRGEHCPSTRMSISAVWSRSIVGPIPIRCARQRRVSGDLPSLRPSIGVHSHLGRLIAMKPRVGVEQGALDIEVVAGVGHQQLQRSSESAPGLILACIAPCRCLAVHTGAESHRRRLPISVSAVRRAERRPPLWRRQRATHVHMRRHHRVKLIIGARLDRA